MKTYARIVDNTVTEIIPDIAEIAGVDVSVEERYHSDFLLALADITDIMPMPGVGWILQNDEFLVPNDAMSLAEKIQLNIDAIQLELDRKANERGYTSIKSACAYASPTEILGTDEISLMREKFRKEGNALQEWMGIVWASAYIHERDVVDGEVDCPSVDEAIALMPEFVWPV